MIQRDQKIPGRLEPSALLLSAPMNQCKSFNCYHPNM